MIVIFYIILAVLVGAALPFIIKNVYDRRQYKKYYASNVAVTNNKIICDSCGSKMIVKNGKHGYFYGCSNFPNCRNSKSI